MAKQFSQTLTPEKALIFRITHRANVPWILENGLHCQSAAASDPNFISIGNPELIDRRRSRMVTIPPGGTLNDYVPFYFTPYSPMLYNISTGYAGIPHRHVPVGALLGIGCYTSGIKDEIETTCSDL
jgi:hypothetical protein